MKPTHKPAPLIELVDIRKTYVNGPLAVEVLRGISLKIYPGEFVAIMGASGSGKSTLMNLLGLLDRPTEGSYFLAGQDVLELDPDQRAQVRNQRIGFVFQSFSLLARSTAFENVELPLVYAGLARRQRRRRAEAALASVGLADRRDHWPSQLSGGEQQRVAIARALANSPRVLLADEPTGNLDPRTADAVFDMLIQLVRSEKLAALIATHNYALSDKMDRTLQLDKGALIESTPPRKSPVGV
jgi:ABC-type lipoprotein export system ATPase subunit